MQDFIYNTPTKVFFGKNRELEIGEILVEYGISKVLLHYGQSSIKKIGLYDRVIDSLNEANIKFLELGGVEPNPKLSLVRKGVEICKARNIELVLAVGGGSVIDSAKAIAVGAKTELDPWLFNLHEAQPTDHIPVGVILTHASAGSEMSNSCVISNDDTLIKRGFNHELNRPLFAIMNPELTYSVSKYQLALGVVDIMMHTLERYFSSKEFIALTDSIALALLKTVKDAGLIALNNPKDYEARATLMWASSLSHNGLTSSFKTPYLPVHQLEHQVSGLYDNIAHAAGLAILYPAWCRLVYQDNIEKFARLGVTVFGVDPTLPINEQAKATPKKMEQYFKELGLETRFSELKLPEIDIEKMALNLTKNKTFKYKNTVRDIDYDFALAVYKESM